MPKALRFVDFKSKARDTTSCKTLEREEVVLGDITIRRNNVTHADTDNRIRIHERRALRGVLHGAFLRLAKPSLEDEGEDNST